MPIAAARLPDASSSLFADRYQSVRALSEAIVAPLSDADATVQPMDDASPAKWHLAHTSWFFETFVLRDHVPGYRSYDERFAFLFNSYYEAEGPRHARPRRGMLTRPSLKEVLEWRKHVDEALVSALSGLTDDARDLVTLGLAHEQQHQELMLTDMLALFAENPMLPAVWPTHDDDETETAPAISWIEGRHGIVEIGHDPADGFAFDCEGPRHPVLLHRHALANRPVSNAE
ncbi:MAG: DinB family protein, partial [Sphingomonadaceae bacterium]